MIEPSQKPARNWWPIGIVISFVLFLGGTASLVTFSLSQRVDLVSPDYYDQEIRHQEQIDRVARTRSVESQMRVVYDAGRDAITIAMPAGHAARQLSGTIQLYRPSEAGLDQRVALDVGIAGEQSVDARGLSAGLWRVRIRWTVDAREFSHEEKVVVQRKTGF